jgi:putative peptidoglycan lipid II flippase
MSKLTRVSILLAFFFGLDKVVAFLRLIIVARQFDLSMEYDAFNVANNIPDMLFMLISGGALAMAFIPVLTETLTRGGRERAWSLFHVSQTWLF